MAIAECVGSLHFLACKHTLAITSLISSLLATQALVHARPDPTAVNRQFGSRADAPALEVLLPGRDNRQFLIYWVAEASGAFADAGVDVQTTVAPSRAGMPDLLASRPDLCAVLPVPLLSRALAQGAPLQIVATLLAGDPANLVLGSWIASEVAATAPVGERIAALRGKRIGLAHGPVPRLHALLAAGGLGEGDVEIRIVRGPQQADALARREIDAVLAHTPYLEQIIRGGHGRLWIHTASGEIPALADLLVHAFACGENALTGRRDAVRAAAMALQRSADLIRSRPDRAAALVGAALEQPVTEDLSLLVELYAPAVPRDLTPSPEALARSAALFPAFGERLSTDPAAVAVYIADLDHRPAFEISIVLDHLSSGGGDTLLSEPCPLIIGLSSCHGRWS